MTVKDMNGVEINAGDTVLVYQEDRIRTARVVEPFFDCPTAEKSGWWVDIDDGTGIEGVMSYILEVINEIVKLDEDV